MFVQILKEISYQVCNETARRSERPSNSIPFEIKLRYAIIIWSRKLNIDENITQYILQGCKLDEVRELINSLWEGIEDRPKTTPFGELPFTGSPFYKLINTLFNRMNIRSENMEFIVIIAFVITAVGYWLYIINQQRQQQTSRREEPRQYSNPPSFTVQTPPIQRQQQTTRREEARDYNSNPPSPPIQRITKQFLILVVSASEADFMDSLEAKGRIDTDDGETLYEITKYLWLGYETDLQQKIANINQYKVSEGEESEYDIYLVSIELNQADERFKSNVNQPDRYDAFRNLADLAVKFKISPRLQMEAYGNFEVYNR